MTIEARTVEQGLKTVWRLNRTHSDHPRLADIYPKKGVVVQTRNEPVQERDVMVCHEIVCELWPGRKRVVLLEDPVAVWPPTERLGV